jgi:hypothetical protein
VSRIIPTVFVGQQFRTIKRLQKRSIPVRSTAVVQARQGYTLVVVEMQLQGTKDWWICKHNDNTYAVYNSDELCAIG